jgi:hypothetical protein
VSLGGDVDVNDETPKGINWGDFIARKDVHPRLENGVFLWKERMQLIPF